jgi:hypothetical protein
MDNVVPGSRGWRTFHCCIITTIAVNSILFPFCFLKDYLRIRQTLSIAQTFETIGWGLQYVKEKPFTGFDSNQQREEGTGFADSGLDGRGMMD